MRQHFITRVAATVLLAVSYGAPSLAEDIGVTAATNPVTTGEPPGQGVSELKIGLNIVRNERIRTTAVGSTQVIFVDRTSLTIGPNSDITIDQYVYNPGAGSGNLALRMSRGVLRFIGGEISHSDQISITTPTATLGIRGGTALVDTTRKKTSIVNLYGTTMVTTPFSSVTLSKPGSYVETSRGRVSDAIAVPPGLLARLDALLASKRGQTGGAGRGLVTSASLRQIVSSTGPSAHPPSTDLSPELEFILSIRPQLESISSAGSTQSTGGTGSMCGSDPDDCDSDHHHRHDHDHHHRHGDHIDYAGHERWENGPHSDSPGWHFGDRHGPNRGSLGPLGLHTPRLPDHIGPNPVHMDVPRHP